MQFQVPQFIEVEDKIFGPLTFKQFVYVTGGVGACYIFWRILPVYIAGPLVIATGGLAAALAFVQWNGRPFVNALEHGFSYFLGAKLYLWSNKRADRGAQRGMPAQGSGRESLIAVPKVSESKLHDLAWSLDVKDRIAAGIEAGGARPDTP